MRTRSKTKQQRCGQDDVALPLERGALVEVGCGTVGQSRRTTTALALRRGGTRIDDRGSCLGS